ncbi:tryptophanase [bacterium]|nr:tryptophanase [bacterium]
MSSTIDFFISKFRENINREDEPGRYFVPRPYRNASVSFRNCSIGDFEKRRDILVNEAGLNAFMFRADMIPGCDLLSDSGTTTMTMKQWAQMLLGDESYGSNEGYFELKNKITETFGEDWQSDGENKSVDNLFIFHQGRAAENAMFTVLKRVLNGMGIKLEPKLGSGLLPMLKTRIESKLSSIKNRSGDSLDSVFIIPSNSHFDTTQGNIVDKGMVPLDLPCPEHIDDNRDFHFRGNMDVAEIENLLENEASRVPLVYITITNNTSGGQPVSIANIKRVREITDRFNIPLFFDACRFAENAWFIKKYEKGYSDKSVSEIVHEMFRYVDGFHISLKKDGLVNMGGALVLKKGSRVTEKYPGFKGSLTDYQIMAEGHPTYGGLAGRDLKGVVEGLSVVVRQDYLDARIGQIKKFAAGLKRYDIPIIEPAGGHAVYINIDKFFDGVETDDFMGVSITALLLIAGHRACELGTYAFGHYAGGKEIPPDPRVNYLRAAVPRLAYEDADLLSFVEAVKILFDHRDRIPGVNVEYGRELSMRHFKSRFSFKQ